MWTADLSITGLRLTLMLEQDEYMTGAFSPTAGARIVLHDPTAPAFPENKGIDIHPGQMTSVSIKFVSLHLKTDISVFNKFTLNEFEWADGQTDGILASVISLTRHLSLSVVLLVPQTDGRTES